MENPEELKLVFTGNMVDAGFLKTLLEDNQIGCLLRNDMQSGKIAGWGAAFPGSAVKLFVAAKNRTKAKELIDKNFKQT